MNSQDTYYWRAQLGKALSKKQISVPTGRAIILHIGTFKTKAEKEDWAKLAMEVILETETEEEMMEKLGL